MVKEKEEKVETEEVVQAAPEEPSEVELVQKENSELKDRLFRALADLENDRKRFERDREEGLKFAITAFARDLLPVSDNLLRALESVSKESLKENDVLKTLYEGVSMTELELAKAFEKNKIEVINPQGDKFNHNEHQAMFEITETDEAEGTITQVLQRGYKLYGRLLRPAMVGVAKPKKA
jgi:molecular chaperone GrpE